MASQKENDSSPVTKLKGTGYCNITYKEFKIAVMMKFSGPQVNSELSPGGSVVKNLPVMQENQV